MNDTKEIRKLFHELRCGRPLDLNGDALPRGKTLFTPVLIRAVLVRAQHEGLSGEDSMTVLAYSALQELEKLKQEKYDVFFNAHWESRNE
jgi:hypothetical protein